MIQKSILDELKKQSSQRILVIGESLRIGIEKEKISAITNYDPWFIDQIFSIIQIEKIITEKKLDKESIIICKK